MSAGDTDARDPIEVILEEFLLRRRTGDARSIEECAQGHPEHADRIRALFPTMLLLEDPPDGRWPGFPGLEPLDDGRPGEGGMGRVYRARETNLDRVVAVKTLKQHLHNPEGRSFFEREARAAASLDHPNIVKIFRFDPDSSPPYFVMQFVSGQPLTDACAGRDHGFVAGVFAKVCRALAYAHERGVVHRDIKPSNILVDAHGEPFLTDFGLAKRLETITGTSPPDVTTLRGTPRYIAPEVWGDATRSGRHADIYALGVTLYTVLCRRPPFLGEDLASLRAQALGGEPPFPVDVDPRIPEPLQRICLQAMERHPEARYQTADSMAEDLERFVGGQEVLARPQRYRREIRGQLRSHLAEIRLWYERRLIDLTQMDRLVRPYSLALDDDSPWRALSRRFPWETVLVRIGAWLILVGSILWPAFYWERLSSGQRILAVGLPALLFNGAGWHQHWTRRRANATVFLLTGALLLPLFVGTILKELEWPALLQDPGWELFEVGPDSQSFAPSNLQILIAVCVFVGYCVLALVRTRGRIFAAWLGTGLYALLASALLLVGLKEWLERDHVSWALLCFVPLTLSFVPLARALLRQEGGKWSAVFYLFFPVPFVAALTLLARFGAEEWLGARRDWEPEEVQLWLMAYAPLYFTIAHVCHRSRRSFTRFWEPFFLSLVPVSVLIPANVLFEESSAGLFRLGDGSVTIYELVALLMSVCLVTLGTKMRRAPMTIPGLCGLAVFVVRATMRHFEETLGWPLIVVLLGAGGMTIGLACSYWRGRRNPTISAAEDTSRVG